MSSSLLFNIGNGAAAISTISTIFYQQLISSSLLSLTMAEICPASTSFSGNMPLNTKIEYYSTQKTFSTMPINNLSKNTKKNLIIKQNANELTTINSILSNLYINTIIKPAKICPDFKDDTDQIACCPSQITQGAYYCCTTKYRNQLQWEMDKEAWIEFIKNNIIIIAFGLILVLLTFIIVTTILCKRISFCPFYQKNSSLNSNIQIMQQNQTNQRYSFGTSRYQLRPLLSSTYNRIDNSTINFPRLYTQQSILHKPPSHFEAPPPYEFVVAPPPLQNTPTNHDWECITENELNNIHQATIDNNNILTTT